MTKLKWTGHYSNGQTVQEPKVKYCDLDRQLLDQFSIIDEKGIVVVTIRPEQDEKLFYRRRTLDFNSPNPYSIYLLGCRRKDSSGKIQTRLYIVGSDGKFIEDTMFRNQWFEPEWYPQEQL